MPTIEITEEQRDRLENVRAELEEHRLGPYGVVRTVDAVEFLLDHYERGVGLAEDSSGDGTERADAGADGGDPAKKVHEAEQVEEPETSADDEEAGDEGAEEAGEEEEAEGDEEAGEEEAEGAEEDEGEEEAEGDEEAGGEGDEEDEQEEGEEAEDDEEAGDEGDEAQEDGAESTSGRLNAMMQLLEEHDDKWEENPDAEGGKYAVTLPDGVTENVRTKDDVRALLFKHY